MTYQQVHQMARQGFSISYIARFLGLNWRTVRQLLAVQDDRQYEQLLQTASDRSKVLQPYESFVKTKLDQHSDTSSAQMHDWLKEHFADLPAVSAKTVFNFVALVRQKYHLPKAQAFRQHQMVEETPYGCQAQVDFGEYNLRDSQGKRVKVFFFITVLSRSRYKYVWFSVHRFTTELAIQAHQNAFAFMQGIPDVMVYDQDRVFIVEENRGDIILTEQFRAYTRERGFTLHFCRKSDPQSKGKVENAVRYVKQNFLYNRAFVDVGQLNTEALGWLARTANHMAHGVTGKQPAGEWEIEKPFLKTLSDLPVPKSAPLLYQVRKDNSFSYHGNFYSLPLGTYQGKGSQVQLAQENNQLLAYDQHGKLLCSHVRAQGRGHKIVNSHHKRDNTTAIAEMTEQLCLLAGDAGKVRRFVQTIQSHKPRYIRDQILSLKETMLHTDKAVVDQALQYCCDNHLKSASDFKSIAEHYTRLQSVQQAQNKTAGLFNPLNGQMPSQAFIQPQTSSISDYDMF